MTKTITCARVTALNKPVMRNGDHLLEVVESPVSSPHDKPRPGIPRTGTRATHLELRTDYPGTQITIRITNAYTVDYSTGELLRQYD